MRRTARCPTYKRGSSMAFPANTLHLRTLLALGQTFGIRLVPAPSLVLVLHLLARDSSLASSIAIRLPLYVGVLPGEGPTV